MGLRSGTTTVQSGTSFDPNNLEATPQFTTQRNTLGSKISSARPQVSSGTVGTIDPEWARRNPDAASAQLNENQWELFASRYRPMEDGVLSQLMGGNEAAATRAGVSAMQGQQTQRGVTERQLARRGGSMTADQQRAAQAAQGLDAARSVGTAMNTARRAERDRNIEGLGTMIGIGGGISGSAGDNLSAAAGMQHAREEQGRANRQANRQATISTAASLVGLGLMAGI